MSKWIVIVIAGVIVGCACWLCGDMLWNQLVAMHGGGHS